MASFPPFFVSSLPHSLLSFILSLPLLKNSSNMDKNNCKVFRAYILSVSNSMWKEWESLSQETYHKAHYASLSLLGHISWTSIFMTHRVGVMSYLILQPLLFTAGPSMPLTFIPCPASILRHVLMKVASFLCIVVIAITAHLGYTTHAAKYFMQKSHRNSRRSHLLL